MSILSGLATAPGVSPLLNAPRETMPDLRGSPPDAKSKAQAAASVQLLQPGAAETARPVIGADAAAGNARADGQIKPSNDGRYVRFVKALQAVRMDRTGIVSSDLRVRELIEAAEDFFLIDDGLPRAVEPLPANPKSRIEPLESIEIIKPGAPKASNADAAETDEPATSYDPFGIAGSASADDQAEKSPLAIAPDASAPDGPRLDTTGARTADDAAQGMGGAAGASPTEDAPADDPRTAPEKNTAAAAETPPAPRQPADRAEAQD